MAEEKNKEDEEEDSPEVKELKQQLGPEKVQ